MAAGLTAVTQKPSYCNGIPRSWSGHSTETPLLLWRGGLVTDPQSVLIRPDSNYWYVALSMWCHLSRGKMDCLPSYVLYSFTLHLQSNQVAHWTLLTAVTYNRCNIIFSSACTECHHKWKPPVRSWTVTITEEENSESWIDNNSNNNWTKWGCHCLKNQMSNSWIFLEVRSLNKIICNK